MTHQKKKELCTQKKIETDLRIVSGAVTSQFSRLGRGKKEVWMAMSGSAAVAPLVLQKGNFVVVVKKLIAFLRRVLATTTTKKGNDKDDDEDRAE